MINKETYKKLSNDSGKIRRILIASLNTAKGNIDKYKSWTHHKRIFVRDVSNIFLFLRRIFKVKS